MQLSPERDRHIRNLSVVPAGIVTYVLLALFIIFARNQQSFSVYFYLTYFGLPFVILVPTTAFLSYEILYSLKMGGMRSFNAKRFLSRTTLLLIGVTIFLADFGLAYSTLSLWLDQWYILLLAGIFWFGEWILLVFRFRRLFGKLEKGEW
jgi:uncharacterized integral membrane protein